MQEIENGMNPFLARFSSSAAYVWWGEEYPPSSTATLAEVLKDCACASDSVLGKPITHGLEMLWCLGQGRRRNDPVDVAFLPRFRATLLGTRQQLAQENRQRGTAG